MSQLELFKEESRCKTCTIKNCDEPNKSNVVMCTEHKPWFIKNKEVKK